MDEHTSAMASRREVRDAIDGSLDEHGAQLVARLLHRNVDEVKRTASVDDPSNEHGARSLMAMAAGGRA